MSEEHAYAYESGCQDGLRAARHGGYTYGQWRAISDAIGDAMQYAHDRAIEHPDKADPLWNLDEYVNRVLETAFGDKAALGRGTCHVVRETVDVDGTRMTDYDCCFNQVGWGHNFCPNCGREVVA